MEALKKLAAGVYGDSREVAVYDTVNEKSNSLYDHYKILTEMHAPLQGRLVLDIGGGSGAEVQSFLDAGVRRYVCVDINKAMVARLLERFGTERRVKAYCKDMAEIKITEVGRPNNSLDEISPEESDFYPCMYDRINLSWSLAYIDDAEFLDVFRKLKFLMHRPDGSLVFTVPHPIHDMGLADPPDYHSRGLRLYAAGDKEGFPIFYRTIADYVNIPIKAGFKLEQMVELEAHADDPFADSVRFPDGSRYPSRLMMKWVHDW
jgi:SAM-dependent methyltransferase